jgi:hypothetical protein
MKLQGYRNPCNLDSEDNRIILEGAKTVLWTLTAIYEDELIEEPHRRENRDRKHRETKGAATKKALHLSLIVTVAFL